MQKSSSSYSDKLKDPRWQKKRLEILDRDEWCCQNCYDSQSTLHIHHTFYEYNSEPWDHDNRLLITLCEGCHKNETVKSKEAKQSLSREISRLFLSDDIFLLAEGFKSGWKNSLPLPYTADLLHWIINDRDIFEDLTQKYFKNLKDNINASS